MQDERTTRAIAYLASVGVALEPAPTKWQRRGFTHYAPLPGQMLTPADLVEFAANERELRS